MENKVKQAGFWNTLIAFMGVAVAGVMVLSMTSGPAAHAAESTSGAAAMVLIVLAFLLMGFLVALFSFFHMHLLGRETLEQLEYEELTQGATDTSMFEADAFPARRSREQFDKWFVPGFTGLLLIFQGSTTLYLFGTLTMQSKTDRGLDQATLVLALSAVFGLLFFLRGRYSTLMSRMGKEIILQPGSDFLLLGSYLLFIQAMASAGSLLEYERLHHYVGAGFVILMAVLTLETLLRLILDIYRPRVEGREVRQLYHSRLVGLISKPESFFTTAGHALNYQFGFEVSETWGYRFVRDRFFMIFLLQIFVLWLSTSVMIIQPNEVGIVQRAGEPVKLDPGIRFKLPWPLESVDRFNPDEIMTLEIGPARAAIDPDNPNPPRLWEAPDVLGYVENISMREELYKEYFLTKPTPGLPTLGQEINATGSDQKGVQEANGTDSEKKAHMVFGHVTIKYRIANVNKWAQVSADPRRILQQVAEREVTREFLQRDATALLTTERDEAARAILGNIRKHVGEMSELDLGLDMISVGLAGLQPPSEPPTKHVMSAQDRDKTKESGSQSPAQAFTNYADLLIVQDARYALMQRVSESNATVARTKAQGIIKQAQTEALAIGRKKKVDDAILAEFLKTYKKSSIVFPYFLYMEQFMRAVGRARRVWAISGSNPQDRIEFKFDKTSGGLSGMIEGVNTPDN